MIARFRIIVDAAYRQQASGLLYAIAKHHAAFQYVCAFNPTHSLLTKILYRECMPATKAGGKIVHAFRDDAAFQFAAARLSQEMQLLPGEMSDIFKLFMIEVEPPIFAFIRLAGLHLHNIVGSAEGAWEAAQAIYTADTADHAWDSASQLQRLNIYQRLLEDPTYTFGNPTA